MWPFRRRPSDAEIARELRDHLELEAEELRARGAARAAPLDARRRFGNLALTTEAVRDVWRVAHVDQLWQDVRQGWRALRHSPVYAVTATITLALGIGASTAIFSLGDPLIDRPFPLLPESRLVWIVRRSPSCASCASTPAEYAALSRASRALSAVGAASMWRGTLRDAAGSELVTGYRVSANLFSLLQAPLAVGRGFRAGDDASGAAPVTVLSYAFWQSRFHASPGVLDSSITLGGTPHRVIGVLGRDLVFPTQSDAYLPLTLPPDAANDHTAQFLDLFGRLAPGATVSQARAEAQGVSAALAREAPRTDSGAVLAARPLSEFHTDDLRLLVLPLAVAVALVLLAACVSVANLALARTSVRRREFAVRAALGGRRGRLARLLATEAAFIAIAGGALGVLGAAWGVHAMRDTVPASFAAFAPGWVRMGIDGRALIFTLCVCIGAVIVFASLPIARATRVDLASVLSDGGRGSAGGVHGTRLRSVLVILEVSVAIVLLSSAALLTRSVRNMRTGDPGVRLDNVLTMHFSLPSDVADSAKRAVYRHLDERLGEAPGIVAAGFATTTPLSNNFQGVAFTIPGQPPPANGQPNGAIEQDVSPDYARVMGVRVLRGRGIGARDVAGSQRAAVINAYMANRYWPGRDPVGETITIGGDPWTIIGVASNVYHGGLDEPLRSEIDRPIDQVPIATGDLEVLTTGDPSRAKDAVRAAIASAEPTLAIGSMLTMREMEARHVSAFVLMSGVLSVFAAVTFVIAIVGLYGVVAYGVAQRTREIGVRIALGAGARRILRHVAGGALRLTAVGIVIGCAGALFFGRLLTATLYRVTASDPTTPLAVAGVLLLVALAAAIVPAWRAARVNPVIALRE